MIVSLAHTLGIAFAATIQTSGAEPLQAIIRGPEDIAVGRTIVLDASSSIVEGDNITYAWYIDGVVKPISTSVEAIYTPEEPGDLLFTLHIQSTIDDEKIETRTQQRVTVFRRKITLIADTSISREKLTIHKQSANEAGVFLRVLHSPVAATPVRTTEEFTTLLSEEKDAFLGAESIILWTDNLTALQALMRIMETDAELLTALEKQSIILITSRGLQTLARTATGPFAVLKPQQIIITRKEAINPLILAKNSEMFIQEAKQRDIDFLVLDKTTVGLRIWNALSTLVNYMVTHGVSSETVILLLMLPIIATILTFFKQVVGITTLGLFTPSIVALSFLALGWWIGLLFLLFIITTGYITRSLMRRWRLLYFPKVAIIITVVSLTLLVLLGIGTFFGIGLPRDTIFILLIMSTLAETFLNLKTEQGLRPAILIIGETIFASLLCVIIVQWSAFQVIILAYPELILVTIVINAFLGKYTGLRLVEYVRFREVLRTLQEE